jgi:hypothetical protein
VVLFADLANPIANASYQRIGFPPAWDSVRVDIGTPVSRLLTGPARAGPGDIPRTVNLCPRRPPAHPGA